MNLTQGQDSISNYYKKLKMLWEELANYSNNCTCGKCTYVGAKEIEQIMSFLMGLNESYSQIRCQILLMDPIPSVNRIFSLLIQEERQRDIGANSSTEPVLAFNIRANQNNQTAPNRFSNFKNVKKDSPYCTHCKRTGHTQDKCYRLHGFPPGYKTQNHRASSNSENRVNAITETQNVQVASSPANEVVTGLTNDQCQQLIALLSGQLASVNAVTTSHSI